VDGADEIRLLRSCEAGTSELLTFVRPFADPADLEPGSDFWERLERAASLFARASWYESLSQMAKAEYYRRAAVAAAQALARDMKSEFGPRQRTIVRGRRYAAENVRITGQLMRGGAVLGGLNRVRLR